jgi:Flp pilus assembly protein TadD
LILLCLAPVAVIPGGENRFVFAKLAVYSAAVGVAALARARGRLPRAVTWLLVAGFAVTALSAALGADPFTAIVGAAPRYEGLPVLALYAGAGWAGARLLGPGTPPESITTAEWALSITAVAVAVIAALETAGLHPLSSDVARPGSLLGNASDEGALGVLIAGTLGSMALSRTGRAAVVATIGVGAASLTVALSASRAALVGFVVAAVILGLASPTGRRVAVVGAVIAVSVVTLVAPGTRARVTGSSPLATATVHGRLLLWQETLALIGHHPLIGIGPGNFLDAITAEHDLRWQQEVGPANPPDSAHNWILQVASVGGLPLLAIVGAICFLTGRAGWRLLKKNDPTVKTKDPPAARASFVTGAFAGLVGYGVALLFGFSTPGTTPLAAALGGAVLAEAPLAAASEGALEGVRAVVRLMVGAGAAVLLVLSIMAAFAEIQIRDALTLAASGDLAAAQSHFHTAQSLRAWDPAVAATAGHAFVVIAQSDQGDQQRLATNLAASWVSKARARIPDSEQVALDEASVRELRGHYRAAAGLLRGVLARDPLDPAVLLRLGVVQGENGQLQTAAATLLEVVRIDPASPDPWTDLAIVYRLEDDPVRAAQAQATANRLRAP